MLIKAGKRNPKEKASQTSKTDGEGGDLVAADHLEGIGALAVETDKGAIADLDLAILAGYRVAQLTETKEARLRGVVLVGDDGRNVHTTHYLIVNCFGFN